MVQAVLKDGRVELLDPLPPDWQAGTRLSVDRLPGDVPVDVAPPDESLEEWLADFVATLNAVDPADDAILATKLAEADVLAKDYVRREMGL